ncbi:hypothetical protein ADUPG1_014014, partial [Aduncisulcus paluster]
MVLAEHSEEIGNICQRSS